MEWYLKVVRDHYADFEGRARRKEYWMFTLFNFLIVMAIAIVSGVLGAVSESLALVGMLAYGVYLLGIIVPSLAVSIRRLHDTGKSGWFLLLSLIPLVSLVLLYFMIVEGDSGPNEYGPDPKDPYADDFSSVLDV